MFKPQWLVDVVPLISTNVTMKMILNVYTESTEVGGLFAVIALSLVTMLPNRCGLFDSRSSLQLAFKPSRNSTVSCWTLSHVGTAVLEPVIFSSHVHFRVPPFSCGCSNWYQLCTHEARALVKCSSMNLTRVESRPRNQISVRFCRINHISTKGTRSNLDGRKQTL